MHFSRTLNTTKYQQTNNQMFNQTNSSTKLSDTGSSLTPSDSIKDKRKDGLKPMYMQ